MVTPAGRAGHSLVELLVAISLLGVALGGAGATSALGGRLAAEAFARQRATGSAAAVLDSLVASPAAPVAGASGAGGGTGAPRIVWRVSPLGGFRLGVTVEARTGGGAPPAVARGVWIPPLVPVEGS